MPVLRRKTLRKDSMDIRLFIASVITFFIFGIVVGRVTVPDYATTHAKALTEIIERGTHFELRSLKLQRELDKCQGESRGKNY